MTAWPGLGIAERLDAITAQQMASAVINLRKYGTVDYELYQVIDYALSVEAAEHRAPYWYPATARALLHELCETIRWELGVTA